MAIDVVDADGEPVAPGQVGELICRKPWPGMTRGIWGDADRYLESYWSRFPGVWCHGDWASVDEDGFWFLHGRSDDTLNIAGKRIGPAEVESVLVAHANVAEAAAVGVPDPVKGEVIWAFVRPAGPHDEAWDAQRELSDLVVAALGPAFRPARVVLVEDLPRTRSAKILRRGIRAAVVGEDPGDLSSLENPTALDRIRDIVR